MFFEKYEPWLSAFLILVNSLSGTSLYEYLPPFLNSIISSWVVVSYSEYLRLVESYSFTINLPFIFSDLIAIYCCGCGLATCDGACWLLNAGAPFCFCCSCVRVCCI